MERAHPLPSPQGAPAAMLLSGPETAEIFLTHWPFTCCSSAWNARPPPHCPPGLSSGGILAKRLSLLKLSYCLQVARLLYPLLPQESKPRKGQDLACDLVPSRICTYSGAQLIIRCSINTESLRVETPPLFWAFQPTSNTLGGAHPVGPELGVPTRPICLEPTLTPRVPLHPHFQRG